MGLCSACGRTVAKVCGFVGRGLHRRSHWPIQSADGGGLPHQAGESGGGILSRGDFVHLESSAVVVGSSVALGPGDSVAPPIQVQAMWPSGGKKPGAASVLRSFWPCWRGAGALLRGIQNPAYRLDIRAATLGQLQFEGSAGVPRSRFCPLCTVAKHSCSIWRATRFKAACNGVALLPKADHPKADHSKWAMF